ncbi:MAG: tetratricopeptide repeat protein [Gammaproteobacteria bacterium]
MALAEINRIYGGDNAQIAPILYEAGLANFAEKNYRRAQEHLSLALAKYQEMDEDNNQYGAELANVYNALGKVYLARSKEKTENLPKARSCFKQALDKKQTIFGIDPTSTEIAEIQRYIGLTYLSQVEVSASDVEESLSQLNSALIIYQSLYGEDTENLDTAETHYHLGCAYLIQKKYPEARTQLTAALTMFSTLFSEDPNNVKIAETYYKLGFTYQAENDLSRAIASYKQALAIYKNNQDNSIDLNYVQLLHYLGKAYCDNQDFAQAKEYLEDAYFKYKALLGRNSNNPLIQEVEGLLCGINQQIDKKSTESSIVQGESKVSASIPNAGGSHTNTANLPTHVLSGQSMFKPQVANSSQSQPQPKPTIEQLQSFYLSKAGFMNASKSIFKFSNVDDVIAELKKRSNKKGGASNETVLHFKL